MAHPKSDPTVASHAMSDDLISFPAREVVIAFMVPETAGPWSAISVITVDKNTQAYSGSSRLSHRCPITLPISGLFVN